MPSTMTCPACRAALQMGNLSAGQQVKCPRCQALVTVPEATAGNELPAGTPATDTTQPCPRCGQPIALSARKCRHCKAWLDADEEDEVYRSEYQPCPRCGAVGAQRVIFTFWGSFYGPALFTHVRCPKCGYGYNGKTGRSNLVPAILFVTVPALLILGIVGGVLYLILSMS